MHGTEREAATVMSDRALDRALMDSFPASDPPAAAGFTPPAHLLAANEDTVTAYLVLARPCADKPIGQWRSCGQRRWVTANLPVLFASLSPASALLEALVNQDLAESPGALVLVGLTLPADAMRRLDTPPEHWRERPYRADVRRCGDDWVRERQSLALRVPSALCPGEFNLLINAAHPQLAGVTRGEPEPLDIDPRLRRG